MFPQLGHLPTNPWPSGFFRLDKDLFMGMLSRFPMGFALVLAGVAQQEKTGAFQVLVGKIDDVLQRPSAT